MLLTRWEPFREWQDMLENTFMGRAGPYEEYPLLNVWNDESDVVVSAELPGMDTGDIEVSVQGDTMTLRGNRRGEELKEGETYLRRERPFGTFTRTLQLPFRVDADRVAARMSKGVLALTLPRSADDRPRKIAIKTA